MPDPPGRPSRRSIRLPAFDYAQPNQYFLTICAFEMTRIFGKIIDNSVLLNVVGRIALDCWRTIPEHFPHVELEPFVVMPNHVHGILTIKPAQIEDGHGCPVPLQHRAERFQGGALGSIPTIVRCYKGSVTFHARRALKRANLHVWQSNYFERVIRDSTEFAHACRYIFDNPAASKS